MTNTLESPKGYQVRTSINITTGQHGLRVYEGSVPLFVGSERSYDDFLFEQNENENFILYDVFTTIRGEQFAYWTNTDTGENYLTYIPVRRVLS